MAIRDRIRSMGLLPDIGGIQADINQKFEELLDELRQIRGVLEQIRDKGGQQ